MAVSKEDLLRYSQRLRELPERIVEALKNAFESDDFEQVEKLIEEYKDTKKDIKLAFIDKSVQSIPEFENREDRRLLQKVVLGENLPFEEAVDETPLEGLLQDELSLEEMERLADDYFTRGYSYVSSLYDAGALIARAGSFPPNLSPVLQEVRECYALERYLAVCMLCRTVLEICVHDIYEAEGLNDKLSDNYRFVKNNISSGQRSHVQDILDAENTYVEDYNPTLFQEMILLGALPKYDNFEGDLHTLRQDSNTLIHNGEIPSRSEAEDFLTRTLRLVHHLYEV